jgi:hypothetical protein
VSAAKREKKRVERKVSCRGDLGRWAGGEGSRPVGRKGEGRVEGFLFLKKLFKFKHFKLFSKFSKTFKNI